MKCENNITARKQFDLPKMGIAQFRIEVIRFCAVPFDPSDPDRLREHFADHGHEFMAADAQEYEAMADAPCDSAPARMC